MAKKEILRNSGKIFFVAAKIIRPMPVRPKKLVNLAVVLVALFTTATLHAETQTFGPISFTVPLGWTCSTDEQNYICIDNSSSDQNSAAIVFSYKTKSATDSMAIYKNQISQPRTITINEVSTPSEVRAVREITLNGIPWLEGVHFASEIANYYTHYFVSIVDPYAVLISISVHQSAYPAELAKLKPTIDSFRISTAPSTEPSTSLEQPASPIVQEPEANTSPSGSHDMKAAQVDESKMMTLFGIKIRKFYLYLAAGLIAAITLLGYAILSE